MILNLINFSFVFGAYFQAYVTLQGYIVNVWFFFFFFKDNLMFTMERENLNFICLCYKHQEIVISWTTSPLAFKHRIWFLKHGILFFLFWKTHTRTSTCKGEGKRFCVWYNLSHPPLKVTITFEWSCNVPLC